MNNKNQLFLVVDVNGLICNKFVLLSQTKYADSCLEFITKHVSFPQLAFVLDVGNPAFSGPINGINKEVIVLSKNFKESFVIWT